MNTNKNEIGDWKLIKRFSDIRSEELIEAICKHGVGHHTGIHGCDGCCREMPKKLQCKVTREKV